jgi:hypothetical protein
VVPTVDHIIERVSREAFGRPLVTNVLRGHVVEAIIASALEPQWIWCSNDYSSWDFERSDGFRLEVKQSAARQTWAPPAHGNIRTSFDIKKRTGRWEGATFLEEPGRAAHIYLFAFNPRVDESTDHRDPRQWEFYVVPTIQLPDTQRISLSAVRALAGCTAYCELLHVISETAAIG